MDLSNLHLPEGLTHLSLTLIGDNNTMIRRIDHVEHFHKSGVQEEDKKELKLVPQNPASEKKSGIVVTNNEKESQVLELLDKLMDGKTKKDAAIIIQAALLAGAILKPTYSDFCSRYGNKIISKALYNRYVGLDKTVFIEAELKPYISIFDEINC